MKKHDQQTKERALLVLFREGGNAARAARKLKDLGIEVSDSTIKYWRDHDRELYETLRQKAGEEMAKRAAADAQELGSSLTQLERIYVTRLLTEADSIHIRDVPAALGQVTKSKAIQYDRIVNPIHGRGIDMTIKLDASELLDSLARRLPSGIVDASSEEIPDAKELVA